MKRMVRHAGILMIGMGIIFGVYGCGKQTGTFGQTMTLTSVTPIQDILSDPVKFAGKKVKVQGEIGDICPAGGWFFLKDGQRQVFVNLHPNYFAIPQARGRQAEAEGVVRKEGPAVEIIGEGVVVK
jgi:hypothetical protein